MQNRVEMEEEGREGGRPTEHEPNIVLRISQNTKPQTLKLQKC